MISLQGALRFNGGGHINHSIFWKNLCPKSQSGEPEGELLKVRGPLNCHVYLNYEHILALLARISFFIYQLLVH